MADQWLTEQIIGIRTDLATIKECISSTRADVEDHEKRINSLEVCVPQARMGGLKQTIQTGGVGAIGGGAGMALIYLLIELFKMIGG
jgi:hypothetical protein